MCMWVRVTTRHGNNWWFFLMSTITRPFWSYQLRTSYSPWCASIKWVVVFRCYHVRMWTYLRAPFSPSTYPHVHTCAQAQVRDNWNVKLLTLWASRPLPGGIRKAWRWWDKCSFVHLFCSLIHNLYSFCCHLLSLSFYIARHPVRPMYRT